MDISDSRRGGGRIGVLAGIAVAGAVASLIMGGGSASAVWDDPDAVESPRTIVVQPGDGADLERSLYDVNSGDVVVIPPGVYELGAMSTFSRGTPGSPITVRAEDPARPPLLRGAIYMNDPDYWHISGLRLEGTIAGSPAIQIAGGVGWTITGTEVFGARRTGAVANAMISGNARRGPRGFSFTNNCVHGAARSRGEVAYHNIYFNSTGMDQVNGVISRNLIFDHPRGGGVKVGYGGKAGTPGPWNVLVERNTIANGYFGVVVHGRVSQLRIARNLMGHFTRSDGASFSGAKRSAIYSHMVDGSGNVAAGNYLYDTDVVVRATGRPRVSAARSNNRGRAPRYNGLGCGAWRPTGRAAAFGAYS